MKKSDCNSILKDIAHQWRQPLSQINSNVFALDCILNEHKIQDPRLHKHLQEIESMTKYMAETMHNFLQQTKEKNSFYIQETLQEAYDFHFATLQEKEITLNLCIEDNFSTQGVSNDLLQVLLVLINNAQDALLERNVFPAIITLHAFVKDGLQSVCVADNAGGMTKTAKEKIFESNYTSKHSSEGSGLGLEMARRIICENFNGDISVENRDKGSCFYITFN